MSARAEAPQASGARGNVGTALLVAALLIVPAAAIARIQPRLAKTVHEVKERDDVYVLPPPAQLHALTLGYDAAAVDLLWAKLLVEYGTHWQEKREFDATRYLDAILEIEPTYAPAYKFADTLLIYKPPRGYEADARAARRYLERGLVARPGDFEVWQQYGQFVAFIGPSFLPPTATAEREAWRRDGANALAHSVELGADAQRTLAAATILTKSGDREASITFLRRAYGLTDSQQTRDEIQNKLNMLEGDARIEEAGRETQLLESKWHRDYPFLTRGEFLLLGPAVDPAKCAGPASTDDVAECPRDWSSAVALPTP